MILEDAVSSTGAGAVGKSLEQLHAVVNRYCLSITGSSWDAEDLAQDTWLKAMGTLQSFGHANPEALLLRIAKNTWIDQTRRKSVLARILQQERQNAALPDNGSGEIETAFQALIKHLPPLQRTVFLLKDVFGYSIAEAAGMLKTTEGAVKAALHRARRSLEDVRKEIEAGALPQPKEEGLKEFLRAITAAYETGDVAALVQLAQQDVVEPAVALGVVQTRLLRSTQSVRRTGSKPTARMAA